ncbi:MAG: WG repeat-containing protein [Bacteroidales bacterium]|nr:WG repeat-containing protein [Bacteroidales bacterium]
MRINKYILTTLALTLSISLSAHTARWLTAPKYESATPISSLLIKVEQNGRFGIIDNNGLQKVACDYSEITAFTGGYCLLLNANDQLAGIMNEQGEVTKINQRFSINASYPYFTDNLLAVYDGKKWGYMDTSGQIAIKTQYEKARPFFYGVASVIKTDAVNKKKYACYINRNGEILYKGADNYLIFASSYTKGNEPFAVIVDPDRNVFARDAQGKRIKNLGRLVDNNPNQLITNLCTINLSNAGQVRSMVSSDGEKAYETNLIAPYTTKVNSLSSESDQGGYDLVVDGKQVLPGQFDEPALAVSNSRVIANKGGLYGLLEILKTGGPRVVFAESDVLYDHHTSKDISARVQMPSELNHNNVTVRVNEDGNTLFDDVIDNSGKFSFKYLPISLKEKGEVSFDTEISIDGIVYPSSQGNIRFGHTNALSISAPGKVKVTETANNTGHRFTGTFTISVTNNSDQESDNCTIWVDGKKEKGSVVIPAGKRENVSVTRVVDLQDLDRKTVSVTVTVKEQGCPDKTESKSIVFDRF